ncbi:LD-carboxypeptidase [Catellatospora sp. TT07R-123]|uniref:S66 family peptidase n=1 Tax=Catellatospora sp. TT07R-123 TaxID=2733863 RepID=UPI001B053517|nr:S66 peptidase family protein [Catellatospora sp. TT07R-123]GHJ45894.1 LD-carboxypeptidase [Catellatospora sp. TT07R-123]
MAVATPSGPVRTPRRLARGVDALRRMGFEVIVGPQASLVGDYERRATARADELNKFIRAPQVRAVIATIGGYSGNAVLPHLDYDALRADPKIICGYSDITAVLLACYTKARIVTFHGPTLLPEVAEQPSMQDYTADHLLRAVCQPIPIGRLVPAKAWTDEFCPWDTDDDGPRTVRPGTGWHWVCEGTGSGPLLGGNIDTLSALGGSQYLPDFTGAVLFLETASSTLDEIERSLTHLEMLGLFDTAAGVLFGRLFRSPPELAARVASSLRRRLDVRQIPVVTDVDLGHTDPMLTLPIGVQAAVDSTSGSVEITRAAVW